jgi:hypothetical protein
VGVLQSLKKQRGLKIDETIPVRAARGTETSPTPALAPLPPVLPFSKEEEDEVEGETASINASRALTQTTARAQEILTSFESSEEVA